MDFKNQTTACPGLPGKGGAGRSHVAEQAQESRASVSGLSGASVLRVPGIADDVIGPETTLCQVGVRTMMKRRSLIGLVVCACVGWTGTVTVRAVPTAVTYWNEVANGAVTIGRPGPIGALDLAIIAAAVHDAVQAIEGRYEPYYFSAPGAEGSTTAAVAAAAYGVSSGCIRRSGPAPPGWTQKFADYVLQNSLAGDPGLDVGDDAAAALFTQYRPLIPLHPYLGGTEPGQWRPTPLANAPGGFESLAHTTPFTLLRASQFRPQRPPPLTSTSLPPRLQRGQGVRVVDEQRARR